MADASRISQQPWWLRLPLRLQARPAFWYSTLFVAVEALGLAFSLWAATKPWYLDQPISPVTRLVGYGHRAAGMGCAIVLYGDSTALADLNPAIIEAKTGLKTCNIAEVRAMADFVGVDFPVDDYLTYNPKPRYLVTAWTPTNFNLNHKRMLTYHPEAYAYALHFDRGPWLWRGMLLDPAHTMSFLVWAQSSLMDILLNKVTGIGSRHPDERARRAAQAGMWAVQRPPQVSCAGSGFHWVPSSFAENVRGVAAFRSHYEAQGIRVIVDATPVANCIADLRNDMEITRGLHDNTLEVLPVTDFNDQDIHLTPQAAIRFSEEVANQIVLVMQREEEHRP